MTPAARLARFSLAVANLDHVEQTLRAAAEKGLVDPVDLPGGALQMAARDVLDAALGWDELLEASRALGTCEPAGGQESYRAFLDSVAEYVRPHSEEIH